MSCRKGFVEIPYCSKYEARFEEKAMSCRKGFAKEFHIVVNMKQDLKKNDFLWKKICQEAEFNVKEVN